MKLSNERAAKLWDMQKLYAVDVSENYEQEGQKWGIRAAIFCAVVHHKHKSCHNRASDDQLSQNLQKNVALRGDCDEMKSFWTSKVKEFA